MVKAEFAQFAAALQTYFPRYKMLPNAESMELWYTALKDLDYGLLSTALAKWVTTEKWPPSIAELREMCSEVTEGKLPDWGDGWCEVTAAIRRYGWQRQEKAMAAMSPTTRETVKRIGWMELCSSENPETIRAQFRQIYETVSKRAVEDRKIPAELRATINQLQLGFEQQKQIGGGT